MSAHAPELQQTYEVSALLDIWRLRFSEPGIKVPLLSDSYLKQPQFAMSAEASYGNLLTTTETHNIVNSL